MLSSSVFSLENLRSPCKSQGTYTSFHLWRCTIGSSACELYSLLCECGTDYRIDLDDFLVKLQLVDAVLISHMRGHTSDMDKILSHCEKLGVPVIEDAAHSLGTTWRGKNIGTFGRLGCFSFQSYKLLNSGEGGMLITDDPDCFAKAVVMSGAYEHNWKKHHGERQFLRNGKINYRSTTCG